MVECEACVKLGCRVDGFVIWFLLIVECEACVKLGRRVECEAIHLSMMGIELLRLSWDLQW